MHRRVAARPGGDRRRRRGRRDVRRRATRRRAGRRGRPAGAASVRSSKPFCRPRGARTTASALMMAPCGGARPSGRSSSTRSSTAPPSKLRTRAGRRCANIPTRGSPVTTATTRPRPDVRGRARSGRARRAARYPTPTPARATSTSAASEQPAEQRTAASRQQRPPVRQRARVRAAFDSAEPDDRGADHYVRGQEPLHGTTSPFRSAIRAGPIPGIASSASTDVNGPCCCR